MGGLVLLLVLSAVMAIASFLAGSLPLAISLSPSQLRIISSLGVGILVGTSMIVIIPEGIEAMVSSGVEAHAHSTRSIATPVVLPRGPVAARLESAGGAFAARDATPDLDSYIRSVVSRGEADLDSRTPDGDDHGHEKGASKEGKAHADDDDHVEVPTFYIGLSMVLGFVLMFLIDRIPRHATDQLGSRPQMRHVSLNNLGASASTGEEEQEEAFLGGLAPPPKQARSFATTIGLVIHAVADGIAMGAGATTSDTQLGLIIFIAIMLHKAPAAFGLSSVLLKQGLSKRAARTHLLVFSLAAPFGALATWSLIALLGGGHFEGASGKWWTGMLLLFSAGTFLYVAMHAMNEEAGNGHDHGHGYADSGASGAKGPQLRDTLITVIGMMLPLLTQFGHHHH
ncbi:zinc transporter SLC39A9 [Plectosphaerella plurivora]|uniref:Zinc transporter SLC39A9 n=1 Tax=Plectosphaerella plurivora TaxID=936078 RepID=A0A9P8V4R6_9PEZI|nr:zinc transporter SLC39A9 [Plectosphaerella plurivora]